MITPMRSLIQFRRFPVDTSNWTPICIASATQVQKAWLEFSDDIKLRSDPNDENTEYTGLIAKGNQFSIPCGLFSDPQLLIPNKALLFYAQAVNGPQSTVLCWIGN